MSIPFEKELEDIFHERENIFPKGLVGTKSKEMTLKGQEEEQPNERSLNPVESAGFIAPLSPLPSSRCPVFGPSPVSMPVRQSLSPARIMTPVQQQRSPSPASGPSNIARRSPASSPLGCIRSRHPRSRRKLSMAKRAMRVKEEKNRLREQRTEVIRHAMERRNDLIDQWLRRSD